MNEQLQSYLDGETTAEELPEELRPEAARWDALLDEARRLPAAEAPPELEDEIMGAVADQPERSTAWFRSLDWLSRPRSVRLSPLSGLVAAAAALLLFVLGARIGPQMGMERFLEPNIYVQFTLSAPHARSVAVAGDFNNWEATHVLEDVDGDGVWTGRLPLTPGVHEYMFVIDGWNWVTDPGADRYSADGFGNYNAVLAVAPPPET